MNSYLKTHMHLITHRLFFAGALALFVYSLPVFPLEDNDELKGDKQESRIDFGNSYIQGQSIKSGAVYLTNRRKSPIKSLLKERKDYRKEILVDYYGPGFEYQPVAEVPVDLTSEP